MRAFYDDQVAHARTFLDYDQIGHELLKSFQVPQFAFQSFGFDPYSARHAPAPLCRPQNRFCV